MLDVGSQMATGRFVNLSAGVEEAGRRRFFAGIDPCRERSKGGTLPGWCGRILRRRRRSLAFADSSFDVVYTTRVLINLPAWDQQVTGIMECLRVARPGGKVILSEAFWEPLVLINAMRALVRLPSLVEHDFNVISRRTA